MKLQYRCTDKMRFTCEADNHKLEMDAKSAIVADTAPNPKHTNNP